MRAGIAASDRLTSPERTTACDAGPVGPGLVDQSGGPAHSERAQDLFLIQTPPIPLEPVLDKDGREVVAAIGVVEGPMERLGRRLRLIGQSPQQIGRPVAGEGDPVGDRVVLDARPMTEQVRQGDPFGDVGRHSRPRRPGRERRVQIEFAAPSHRRDRQGRDRFGRRGDVELCLCGDRNSPFDIREAVACRQHGSVPVDHRDRQPGHGLNLPQGPSHEGVQVGPEPSAIVRDGALGDLCGGDARLEHGQGPEGENTEGDTQGHGGLPGKGAPLSDAPARGREGRLRMQQRPSIRRVRRVEDLPNGAAVATSRANLPAHPDDRAERTAWRSNTFSRCRA